ncbi:hypothetical protein C8R44DRAFT_747212 [Mycena epipterygia]|nr:hypothetical protein C8R44DRAFT_747212 [Mycena epipterygia]
MGDVSFWMEQPFLDELDNLLHQPFDILIVGLHMCFGVFALSSQVFEAGQRRDGRGWIWSFLTSCFTFPVIRKRAADEFNLRVASLNVVLVTVAGGFTRPLKNFHDYLQDPHLWCNIQSQCSNPKRKLMIQEYLANSTFRAFKLNVAQATMSKLSSDEYHIQTRNSEGITFPVIRKRET